MSDGWADVSSYPEGVAGEAIEAGLKAALRKLTATRGVATDQDLAVAVWNFETMAHRAAKPISAAKSRAEAKRLTAKLAELSDLLESMHLETTATLIRRAQSLWTLKAHVRLVATELAHGEPQDPPPQVPRGAPKKIYAAMVASYAAEQFHTLTASWPTVITPAGGGKAYGPFMDFLCEIFEALGIVASIEGQARKAIAAMEK